jgi:hypothetical protein
VQQVLDECPRVKFLFTSRYNIGSFVNNAEKVIELKELPIKYAVQLLFQKAPREINDKEIEELLRIQPEKRLHSNPMGSRGRGLESHHMFEILKGHPHAISLAAPSLQYKRLSELYALLNSDSIMDWLEHEGIKDDPMGSLKVSMDLSISQLSAADPEAIDLFWLIGLLPGGCTPRELDLLWGSPQWASLAEKLLRASLLVKRSLNDEESLFQLFPFMNQYASLNMSGPRKAEDHAKITRHYIELCKALLSEGLEKRIRQLVAAEDNIWACFYRARDAEAPRPLAARAATPLSIKPSSGTSMSNHSEEMVSSASGKPPQIISLADSSKG